MASAKASSFHMTALPEAFPSLAMLCVEEVQFTGRRRATYIGTAGAVLDASVALGAPDRILSSCSRAVFSCETSLRVAIVCD